METDEEAHIRVVPPLLRREVLCCEAASGEYVHGYMVNAGFGESISQWHEQHPEVPLHFFWDKPDEPEVCRMDETLSFHQLDDENSFAICRVAGRMPLRQALNPFVRLCIWVSLC